MQQAFVSQVPGKLGRNCCIETKQKVLQGAQADPCVVLHLAFNAWVTRDSVLQEATTARSQTAAGSPLPISPFLSTSHSISPLLHPPQYFPTACLRSTHPPTTPTPHLTSSGEKLGRLCPQPHTPPLQIPESRPAPGQLTEILFFGTEMENLMGSLGQTTSPRAQDRWTTWSQPSSQFRAKTSWRRRVKSPRALGQGKDGRSPGTASLTEGRCLGNAKGSENSQGYIRLFFPDILARSSLQFFSH